MEEKEKKAFVGNFSNKRKSPMVIYLKSNIEQRKQMFHRYLSVVKRQSNSTIRQYVGYHLKDADVLSVIKKYSGGESLYDVTDIQTINKIWEDCNQLPINKKRNGVYTASVRNYEDFINYLRSGAAYDLYQDEPKEKDEIIQAEEAENEAMPHKGFSIKEIIALIDATGLLYNPTLIKRFAFSLLSKQFLILSGLAGSGKTQLALAFASALIQDDEQMCVVPVGADWTNREPLLGFPNALVDGKYEKPESGVLELLVNANKAENSAKPYFLILDEMNMSYVERYFADFLSAMESHKAIPLWKGSNTDEAPNSIKIPNNLFIIGTINVDETTYMFSPKVLDRANVIEFKISDEEMATFLKEMKPVDRDSINNKASDMGASFVALAKKKDLADNDGVIQKTLNAFFGNLKSVNAEFGYRSATEIYRFISQSQNNDDSDKKMTMDEILDSAIVQKLLPKLHGSRKKLEPILLSLWKECFESDKKETTTVSRVNVEKAKYPLTADKIQRMYDAAYANGFTSFAEA